MGAFYVNYTVRGSTQKAVAEALKGWKAVVLPEQNGCVTVAEERSDSQDTNILRHLSNHLSSTLRAPTLCILNHDDDLLVYFLSKDGQIVDQYNSQPDYFEDGPASPAGGNAAELCSAFGCRDLGAVEEALRDTREEYLFAMDRHQALVTALGSSDWAIGLSYAYYTEGMMPPGIDDAKVVRTQ